MKFILLAITLFFFLNSCNIKKNESQIHSIENNDVLAKEEIPILRIEDSDLVEGFDFYKYPLTKKGMIENNKGNYKKAIKYFLKAEKQYKLHKTTYLNLGSAYASLDDFPSAIDALTKSLEIDENYIPALLSRGLFYGYNGEFEKAEKDINAAIKLKPDEAACYLNLTVIYDLQGLKELACLQTLNAIAFGGYEKFGEQLKLLQESNCK